MPKLLKRLVQICLTVAITLPAAPVTATEGNPSLFSTGESAAGYTGAAAHASLFAPEIDAYGSISEPMEMPRPKPLLYTGAERVSIEGAKPEQFIMPTGRHYSASELECLAEALYFEARGEGRKGQIAVAEVIINRTESKRFPSNICEVVNQPSQFSYTIGGRKAIPNNKTYRRVLAVAEEVLDGTAFSGLTHGATYFHTTAVRPEWSHRFIQTAKIGRHIFYATEQRMAFN